MPRAVLKHLPPEAQQVWEEAYNAYKKKGLSDSESAQRAWGAIKATWAKGAGVDGKWTKKKMSLSRIFAASDDSAFEESSDGGTSIFKKALISVGEWLDPNNEDEKYRVTETRIDRWMENFEAGRPKLVTIPVGHEGYKDALANTGYLRDLEFDGTTLYGMIEFTSTEAAKLAKEGSIPAVSIAVYDDYVDTKDGKSYGEAIYHIALTHSPWIEGMDGFQSLGMVPDGTQSRMLSKCQEEGPAVGEDNKVVTKDGSKPKSKEAQSTMTDEEKKELDSLKSEKAELEKKLNAEQDAKEALLSKQRNDRTTALQKRIADAFKGDLTGSKFGIPGEHTEKKLLSLLDSLIGQKVVHFEFKAGEKTEKSPDEVLVELIEEIVKIGVVALERKTGVNDQKPGEGEEEDGKGFAKRQMERKDIGPNAGGEKK